MIKVRNLTKYYGERLAVDNISFNIGKGEIVGLLGPNAAGKSTTMRILTGFLMPTKGDTWIADCNMVTNSLEGRKHIGYMPESVPLYTDMTVRDYLDFFARLRGVERQRARKRINDVVTLCHLEEYIDTIIGKLSRGFRQRVGLAQAIVHEPEVLILDEPTVGIDPQSRNLIFEVVEKLHKEGMTIIYTTHYMEEAERLCDRIGIIDNGKIIAQGTLNELRTLGSMKESVVISYTNLTDERYNTIEKEWNDLRRIDDTIHFYSMNIQSDLSKIILKCNEFGLDIRHIDIQKINLETIFLSLTGKQLRDK